jgi:hypothetical protein
MPTCPNKNTPNWRSLHNLVPSISNYVWDKLNGQIDQNGYPEHNLDKFKSLLSKNNNDFKNTYLEYMKTVERISIDPDELEIYSSSLVDENIPLEEDILTDSLKYLDSLGEIRSKAVKALETKLEIEATRKHLLEDDILKRKALIDKLSKLEADKAMVLFVNQAAKSTENTMKEYNFKLKQLKDIKDGKSNLKEEDIFNPKLLYNWRDYLSAYDTIEDYQNYLIQNNELSNKEELEKILTEVIKNKNAIKDLYVSKGLDMAAKFLAPNYNKLYVLYEKILRQKYSKLDDTDKAKITEREFIDQQLKLNDENLKQKTILLIRRELQKAGKDINLIARWVENAQESSDPVVAAATKALTIATMKSQTLTIKAKDNLVEVLRELEKSKGSSTNKKDFYDFMLEKDSKDNYTGNIVDRFGSQFWIDYENQREYTKTLEPNARKTHIKTWTRLNTVFDKTKFNRDKWNLIQSLIDDGKLSDIEVKELEWNDVSYNPLSTHDMQEKGMLNMDAADVISECVYSNVWNYRTPISKYSNNNKGWNQLSQILKNPNDPRSKFYNTIKGLEEESASYLPTSLRLRTNQLPGIIKSNEERIIDKESIKDIAKSSIAKQFDVLADDTSRGVTTIQDEQGNERNFLPSHYTGKLDIKDQSFDLPTIYLRYFQMTADYGAKNEILPEMELTKFFINNRELIKTDSKGNPVLKALRVVEKLIPEKVTKPKGNNQLADQFNDWFDMVMYGKKEIDEGDFNFFGLKFDKAKLFNYLNKFTSLNILALNFKAGVNNVLLGEALQTSEAYAGQHMTVKSYTKANKFFWSHFMGVIEDIGKRTPDGIVNKLYEHFQVSPELVDTNLKNNTVAKALVKTSTLYSTLHMGDYYMQSRLFLGMLANIDAKNSKGESLGSMLDMYTIRNGNLTLNPDVDINKSNWTKEDQTNFSLKVKTVMSGIHGEYTDTGRSAMQRYILGRMGIMFRKYVVPGLKRRYKKSTYIEKVGDYSEGYYRTTVNYFGSIAREFRTLQFSAFGEEWSKLSNSQKSNLIRTAGDVLFLTASIILASIALGKAGDDDDNSAYWANFTAYQMLRFKTDILFFTPKIDEAMTILRSPMATMSLLENVGKLTHQLASPGEEYQRGPWKRHLKLEKIIVDFIPVVRSFYQTRDIKNQINFLK